MKQYEPTHIDLFSGIGGFALAAKWAGFRTIAFCEIDKYCQKVLAKNFGAEVMGNSNGAGTGKQIGAIYPEGESTNAEAIRESGLRFMPESASQIVSNIFDFDGTQYRGCDLLTGGFPCQPFSVAGKRRGAADDRAIWPEMFRVISEARPAWVLGENVPGIIPMELDNVLSDLEGIGYATRSFVIPACAVDARHRRDRLWIVCRYVGNAERTGPQGYGSEHGLRETGSQIKTGRTSSDVSDPGSGRQQKPGKSFNAINPETPENGETTESLDGSQPCIWLPEPDVGRVAHGIPARVDRLKGLGNAIVPQVAYQILREIYKLCLTSKHGGI